MRIDVKIPYGLNHRLAEAYNVCVEESMTDWVLLLDHDVFLSCNPYWYQICLRAIEQVDDITGMITCVCNPPNIKRRTQNPDIYDFSTDIEKHVQISKKLWEKHGIRLRRVNDYKIAGFFMLIRKSAWENVKFKEQGKVEDKIDWRFAEGLIKKGYKIYELPGLYVYHKRGVRKVNWEKGVL